MAKKLKKNTGKGLITPKKFSQDSVEETLKNCGALILFSEFDILRLDVRCFFA